MNQLEKNAHLFTDPHFNHPRLVEKGLRTAGYEELVAESWRTRVQPQDRVYCLGDVCMKAEASAHDKFVKPMPGYKILIRGNHDKQRDTWYLSHGWDEVHDSLLLTTTVNGRHTRVLLSHAPTPDEGNKWDINVHGHFHNDAHRANEPANLAIYTTKHRLLALECVGYELISFVDFLEGRIEQRGLWRQSKEAEIAC